MVSQPCAVRRKDLIVPGHAQLRVLARCRAELSIAGLLRWAHKRVGIEPRETRCGSRRQCNQDQISAASR